MHQLKRKTPFLIFLLPGSNVNGQILKGTIFDKMADPGHFDYELSNK